MARHDADLAFTWRNNTGAVRPDQSRAARLQELPDAHHVERRNSFSNTDDQLDLGVCGLHDRVGSEWRRNEDDGCIGAGLVHRFLHGIEDWPTFMRAAAFAGGDAPNDLGAVLGASLCVE